MLAFRTWDAVPQTGSRKIDQTEQSLSPSCWDPRCSWYGRYRSLLRLVAIGTLDAVWFGMETGYGIRQVYVAPPLHMPPLRPLNSYILLLAHAACVAGVSVINKGSLT